MLGNIYCLPLPYWTLYHAAHAHVMHYHNVQIILYSKCDFTYFSLLTIVSQLVYCRLKLHVNSICQF
jgi:hypothetical protein